MESEEKVSSGAIFLRRSWDSEQLPPGAPEGNSREESSQIEASTVLSVMWNQ